MAKYKVEVGEGCISCGNCAAVCPDIFELKEKSEVKKPEIDDSELACAKDAAEQCPVSVIHITDTEKKEKII